MKTSAAFPLIIGFAACFLAHGGEPGIPSLDRAEREAIIAAANQAVHKHMTGDREARKGNEIARKLWGEAIARLKPLRVRDDRVNVFIVLREDETAEEGLYVSVPFSSYAPGMDERFLLFEKLSQPTDRAFGHLYHCKLQTASAALAAKLKKALRNLCTAVECAYREAGLTKEDVEAVLAEQAAPGKLMGPYQAAWPAVLKARRAAIQKMAALGAGAVPLLLKAKDESLGGTARGDIFVDALEKIGKPAVPALLDGLSHPDTQVRSRAVTALARTRDPRAVEPVLRLLEEPDQSMTHVAVWALSLLKDQRAVEPLLRLWNKEDFRPEVATALGFQQDKRAVPPIVAALEDCLAEAQKTAGWNHHDWLMLTCATALGRLRDPAAIPVLKRALQAGPQRAKGGEAYLVAEAAAEALRTFGFRIEGDRAKGGYHVVAAPATSSDR